jgi:hypothetical protein
LNAIATCGAAFAVVVALPVPRDVLEPVRLLLGVGNRLAKLRLARVAVARLEAGHRVEENLVQVVVLHDLDRLRDEELFEVGAVHADRAVVSAVEACVDPVVGRLKLPIGMRLDRHGVEKHREVDDDPHAVLPASANDRVEHVVVEPRVLRSHLRVVVGVPVVALREEGERVHAHRRQPFRVRVRVESDANVHVRRHVKVGVELAEVRFLRHGLSLRSIPKTMRYLVESILGGASTDV